MKNLFFILILFWLSPQVLLADEVVCEAIPSDFAKIRKFESEGVVSLEIFFPKKVGNLDFHRILMRVVNGKNKCKSCEDSSIEVLINAAERENSMVASVDLKKFDASYLDMTAYYVGVCVSELKITFFKADLK